MAPKCKKIGKDFVCELQGELKVKYFIIGICKIADIDNQCSGKTHICNQINESRKLIS